MSFLPRYLIFTNKFDRFNWRRSSNSQLLEWLVVASLVLLGGLLRFANFPTTLVWTNDSSRDISVAYFIAEKQLWPTVGHFNTGINGNYPPFYFYFLGGLAMVNSSPAFIGGVNIFFHILSLVAFYLIGKVCLGKKFGWLVLLAAVFSFNLIFTARYASPASWNLPLYLVSLWAVLSWFKNPQFWRLVLSLSLGLISLQVHGAQIGLVLITLTLMLANIIARLRAQAKIYRDFFIWLGLASLVMLTQVPLFKTILSSQNIVNDWSLARLASAFFLAGQILIDDQASFKLVGLAMLGLAIVTIIKFGRNLFQPPKHFMMTSSKLPAWWWFSLSYVILFELALSLLESGMLNHHQVYLLPCWLILILGLTYHWSQKIWPIRNQNFAWWLVVAVGLLLAKSLSVAGWGAVVSPGWYGRSQALAQEMFLAKFPIQTADVLQVDNNVNNLAGVSNSTKIWWFLTTEFNRRDLRPLAWIFDRSVYQAAELVIICDLLEAKDFDTTCQPQAEAVLAKRFSPQKLIKTATFKSGFEVRLYKNLSLSDYACVKPAKAQ